MASVSRTASKLTGNSSLRPAVVITGGSEGIGLAIANEFAKHGRDIFLVARRADALKAAAQSVEAGANVRCQFVSIDLSSAGCEKVLREQLAAAGAYADVLVNSAASGVAGPFAENDPARIDFSLNLNIGALTGLSREFLPDMITRKSGGILNVASLAGLVPAPNASIYCATKAYVIALTRSLAWETRSSGVTVSAVIPGPVATSFLGRSMDVKRNVLGLIPALSAESVAKVAVEGFLARQIIITPGIISAICRFGLKIMPHWMVMQIVRPAMQSSFWTTDDEPSV